MVLGQPTNDYSISKGFVAGYVSELKKNSSATAIGGLWATMVPTLDAENAVKIGF